MADFMDQVLTRIAELKRAKITTHDKKRSCAVGQMSPQRGAMRPVKQRRQRQQWHMLQEKHKRGFCRKHGAAETIHTDTKTAAPTLPFL